MKWEKNPPKLMDHTVEEDVLAAVRIHPKALMFCMQIELQIKIHE